MTLRARLHWLLFASYVALFFALPLTLLWSWDGLRVGLLLTVGFLFYLGVKGTSRIAARLHVRPLSRAESPTLYNLVEEHCRRLALPTPAIGVIETGAVNTAIFGMSRRSYQLVVTRGVLDTFTRHELSAVVGRQLSTLWNGGMYGDSWLSQFLSLMDSLVAPRASTQIHLVGKRSYGFRVVMRQALLYPLTLFPVFVLRLHRDASELDLKALKVTRRPHAYAEALRRMESLHNRIPFTVPFSGRHLFLLAPPTEDPLARVFFGSDSLLPRIHVVEQLKKVVSPTC
jgi:Zn-dependent protease with chaperone function